MLPQSWCSSWGDSGPTAPPGQEHHRKWRRVHGLQPPLNLQQVLGWLALLGFGAGSFGLLVPSLRRDWQAAAFATLAALCALHLAAHLTTVVLDPAEEPLRTGRPFEVVPEFDRSKHAHVIENGRCHLCNIDTSGPRTKHCGVCNKCVAGFDHHCKWLNHCVGGRNYWPFLMCVATATAAALVVTYLAVLEVVLYHVDLDLDGGNGTLSGNATDALLPPAPTASPAGDTLFLASIAVLGVLAALTACLLLHLCFFHLYISFLGLTTYEYIRSHRQSVPTTLPANGAPATKQKEETYCTVVRHRRRPASLHCCNYAQHELSPKTTVYTCSLVKEEERQSAAGSPCPSCCRPAGEDDAADQEVDAEVFTITVAEPAKKPRPHHRWNCCRAVPDSPDDPAPPRPKDCDAGRRYHNWYPARLRMLLRVLASLNPHRKAGPEPGLAAPRSNRVVPLPEERPRAATPALPPPRRKICSEPELEQSTRPLRRGRRSTLRSRPRSPALSPIRETGLSNPASPARQSDCVITVLSRPCMLPP